MIDKPKLWQGPSAVGEGAARGNEISGAPYQTHIAPGVTSRKMGMFSEVTKDEEVVVEKEPVQLYINGMPETYGAWETYGTPLPEVLFRKQRVYDPGVRISRKWLANYAVTTQGQPHTATYFRIDGAPRTQTMYTYEYVSVMLAQNEFGKNDGEGLGWDFSGIFTHAGNLGNVTTLFVSPALIGVHDKQDNEELGAIAYCFGIKDGVDQYGVPLVVPAILVIENNGDSYFGPVTLPLDSDAAHNHVIPIMFSMRPDRMFGIVARLFTPGNHPSNPEGNLYLYVSTDRARSFSIRKPFGDIIANMPDPPEPSQSNPHSEFVPTDTACDYNQSLNHFVSNSRGVALTETLGVIVSPYFDKNGDLKWVSTLIDIESTGNSNPTPISFAGPEVRTIQSLVPMGNGKALLKVFVGMVGTGHPVEFYELGASGATKLEPTGLPATATANEHFGEPLLLKRYKSEEQKGWIVMPVWDEEGYALYASKDLGRTWKRKRYIKRTEYFFRMDNPFMAGEEGNNFGQPRFMGTPQNPAPMDVAVPSRFGETT